MIDYVESNEVKKLADNVDMVLADNANTFGGFQMVDITRQIIFNMSILIRAYSSLLADIAQMWVEISAKHLDQGSQLLDDLEKETQDSETGKPSSALSKKIADLKTWSGKANEDIKTMAEDVRNFASLTMLCY